LKSLPFGPTSKTIRPARQANDLALNRHHAGSPVRARTSASLPLFLPLAQTVEQRIASIFLRRWSPTALDLRARFPRPVSQNLFLLAMLLDFPSGEYITSCNRDGF
jgi:hypothetical protein